MTPMSEIFYSVYQCSDPTCCLRFPALHGSIRNNRCPRCKSLLQEMSTRSVEHENGQQSRNLPYLPLEALLDNVRSGWNVGAIFRTADGFRIQRLYLCGITPVPGNQQVDKTALGAQQSVGWTNARNAVAQLVMLQQQGKRIWALEETAKSDSIYTLTRKDLAGRPIVLVVGNELSGVDTTILEASDRIISIPMRGVKRSLNVSVAFGIAASFLSAYLWD